jgi:mutual gliding-motility protein MglA
MALIRHDSREIQFKIVYCGPPEGGKTSNLEYIHRRLDAHHRGDLVSISTGQNRTICFDFLPVHAMEIAGYRTRFQLYTVPGQEVLADTRQTVLAGADGVVFVADSTPGRLESNLAAHRGYRDSLLQNQVPPDSVPVVYQYNKRDCHGAIRPEDLDEALHVRGPSFLVCATSGYQVFATLDYLTGRILRRFHASLERNPRSERGSEMPERTLVLGVAS